MTDLHQVTPPDAPAGQPAGHGTAEPSHAAVALQVSPPTQHPASAVPDIVDVWGLDSFPASDPPANW